MTNPFESIISELTAIKSSLAEIQDRIDRPTRVYDPDERLTRAAIKNKYGISYPTIHAEMKRGLPYEKVGRKTLFRRADVDAYFQKKGLKKA